MERDRAPAAGMIPPEVREGVVAALGVRTGDGPGPRTVELVEVERLGGGCIHPAARIRTGAGDAHFLKWSNDPGPAGFDVEARGLQALADRDGLRIPEVRASRGGAEHTRGWLLLELIEAGPPGPDTAERLGEGLARMHRPLPGSEPGWEEDGFIGPLPQRNVVSGADWSGFWIEARLVPQWERARPRMDPSLIEAWERLLPRVEAGLEGWDADGLSLLHGDLWSGNVLTDRAGEPVLIDPAVYRGHREVDLAMMELFGGFSPAIFRRYRELSPLEPGYEERRRDIYQLYPLLVHVNLFGGGYVGSVRDRLRRLSRTLG